jgi:hypothetical protein
MKNSCFKNMGSHLTGPTPIPVPSEFSEVPGAIGATDCASTNVPLCHNLTAGDISPLSSLVYGKIGVCKFPGREGTICMPWARERGQVR